jgi:HEPN domain-containing protein
MNIPKQIEYWLKTAEEDFEVGRHLVEADKVRHGLFFIHLAMEKILKACIYKNQNKTPPKIHNLLYLADIAKVDLDNEQKRLLIEINEFNLEGRYPLDFIKPIEKNNAVRLINSAWEAFECFRRIL